MRATNPSCKPAERNPRPAAIVIAVILLLLAAAACATARPTGRRGSGSEIDATVTTRFDAAGSVTAVVHVSLAYRNLVFTREDGVFRSTLRLSVVAEHRGERVGGGFAEVVARAPDYAATRTDRQLRCAVDVPLPLMEKVDLRLHATVSGTSRIWERDIEFDPGAAAAVPYHFSGFSWNLEGRGGMGRVLLESGDTLSAVLTLASHPLQRDTGEAARLMTLVRNEQGQERILDSEVLPTARGDTLVHRVSVPAADMPFGPLEFTARVAAGDGGTLDLTPGRDFVNLALPWHDEIAWRRHVAWLEKIADADERRRLAGTSPAGRPAAWRAIWAARPPDADPGEREHLLRIVEADQRFGHFGRGALSDQGRVFIFNGPPDRIDSREMDSAYPGVWQIWYYRALGMLFRFYDAYGMGDFRLYDTALY